MKSSTEEETCTKYTVTNSKWRNAIFYPLKESEY
uniref:COX3 domain containing protein n=1 Tax=Fusarium pseudograminearum CS3220 TaxID=1318456 RepID=W1I7N3_FUSPS|nr:COX3 domain containing protein [Fusarium pseudograminearum CS3220]CDX48558.1 COX3 domain containing protein [Fusarium pseudograminearum CS3220]